MVQVPGQRGGINITMCCNDGRTTQSAVSCSLIKSTLYLYHRISKKQVMQNSSVFVVVCDNVAFQHSSHVTAAVDAVNAGC